MDFRLFWRVHTRFNSMKIQRDIGLFCDRLSKEDLTIKY